MDTNRSCGVLREQPKRKASPIGKVPALPTLERKAQAPTRIFTVPLPENPFFTERATELSDLQTALEKTGSFALTGLGGVGKTQTAAEYSHRRRENYQAVLWLRAESQDTLFADLTALARLLKLPEAEAQEQQLAVDAAQRWLDETDNWLLILDNVNDLKTVDALTRKARPNRHHVIVTQQAQATGTIAAKKNLPIMQDDTGATLLLRRAELIGPEASLSEANPSDAAAAKRISSQLGGLPLALDQAGAYIGETKCAVGEYLELLNLSLPDLLKRRGELDLQHVSVMATYTASLTELAKQNEAAAELLKRRCVSCARCDSRRNLHRGCFRVPGSVAAGGRQSVAVERRHRRRLQVLLVGTGCRKQDHLRTSDGAGCGETGMKPEERAQWAERVVNAVNAAFPGTSNSRTGALATGSSRTPRSAPRS